MKHDDKFTEIKELRPLETDAIKEHIEMLNRHLETIKERKVA
jgi:hypothetical protein